MRGLVAILVPALLGATSGSADGRLCAVHTRCHNALPCQPEDFEVRLELEGKTWVMTTPSDGGRMVFQRAYGERHSALFLEGHDGADHGDAHVLVSLHNEVTLLMSVHNATATPVVETFLGACEVIG